VQPEAGALLRKLMAERGLPTPPLNRTLDTVCVVEYTGHTVQVTGVLNRRVTVERIAVDRINVMSVESIAPACGSPSKPA
jgi:hypothetical protein